MSTPTARPRLARQVLEFQYGEPIAGTRAATVYAGFASIASALAVVAFVAGLCGWFGWRPGAVFVLVAIPGWYVVTLVLGRVVIEGVLSVARFRASRVHARGRAAR